VATDSGTSDIGLYDEVALPRQLSDVLNSTGRLVSYTAHVDTSAEVAVMKSATETGSWHYAGDYAGRSYFDLSNHVACGELVRKHEQQMGIEYSIYAHSRLDVLYFQPLPTAIHGAWRSEAEAAGARPLVFKPVGVDNCGVLDLMAVANRAGWQALEGVRDAVTLGTPPFNMLLNDYFSEELNETYPDGRGSVYPEQFTAAQIHEKNVNLLRAMWGYCRVDDKGQCRYAGEVDNLLMINEDMAKVAIGNPMVSERLGLTPRSVYVRPLNTNGSIIALTLHNDGSYSEGDLLTVPFDALGWPADAHALLHDTWQRKAVGEATGEVALPMPPDRFSGAPVNLFRLTRVDAQEAD